LLNPAGGKPVSDLQSLKHLLEQEVDSGPQYGSEEGRTEGNPVKTDSLVFGGPEEMSWRSAELSNSALERLFKDLLRTSKRSWSRYKKGGLRSCFGVRLDRIGSFSGLGC
ncbi:natriuretic peptide A-like, partial [Salarias fasciatus]